MELIFNIAEGNYLDAEEEFYNRMENIAFQKLDEKKIATAAQIDEENLDEARVKIVKARFRAGKLERRKKVSTQPGFTFRNGKLQRMSPAERRNRKMSARRSKSKRRASASRSLMKRKRTLRKRKAMGL